MVKSSDFRQKEVINIFDGKRLGFVCDVDIDMNTGRLNSIIVPANGKLFGSVTNKDIAEALIAQHHIKIDKRRFEMDDIKQTGEYKVNIRLYPDIVGELKVIIKEA